MKRLAPALFIAVLAAAWSMPAGAAADPGQSRQRGSRPAQAQRAPQRAPQRAAPPRRASQPRRVTGAGRVSAPPAGRRGAVRRAAPRTSGAARATTPRTAGRPAERGAGRRIQTTAPRGATRAVPERDATRRRIGGTAAGGTGRAGAVRRTPERRAGATTTRDGGRVRAVQRTAERRGGGTASNAGRAGAVRRTPDRRVGATTPRDDGRRIGSRAASPDTGRRAWPRRAPDAAVTGDGRLGGARRGGGPGIGTAGNARRAGRIADAGTGRRGAAVVDRRGPRGNAVRRADARLASRPIVINNYVDGGRRGHRGFRNYRGRHRHGIPHIHGSYFYFPGYSTFSLGVAVGSGLRYYDPYWNPYWYGYYGHRYGYAAWDWGARYDYYTGSLRLKVRPRFAEVYVDGYYAGQVDNYDGIFQRLRLEEGPHHIEIRHPGYVPQEFEVMILPGETITYEGVLQPF